MSEHLDAEEVDDAPSPRRVRLSTVDEVRVEMARVYRDMRGKKIDTKDGSRLVYVLSMLAQATHLAVTEQRVADIVKAMERRRMFDALEAPRSH